MEEVIHSFDIIKGRVVRNGCVAVLYSPGYGAGWYSWHRKEELLYDPTIVQLVLDNRHKDIHKYLLAMYQEEDAPYMGGSEELSVEWVPVGEQFRIDEYDGAESVVLASRENWLTA
jgi:hypothetical protein